jgi:hypothetical protein
MLVRLSWVLGVSAVTFALACGTFTQGDCESTYIDGTYCTCVITFPTPPVLEGCSPNGGAACDPTISTGTKEYPLPPDSEQCTCDLTGLTQADGGPAGAWFCVVLADAGP